MRSKLAFVFVSMAVIAAAASAQIATITGNMDANMVRGETRTFPLSINIGDTGYKGTLAVKIRSLIGLPLGSTVIQPPILKCDNIGSKRDFNFVNCAGEVALAAGQSISLTQTITTRPEPYFPSPENWSVELGGDFLSGAPLRVGIISLPHTPAPRLFIATPPKTILQDSDAGAPFASTTIAIKNIGDADGNVQGFIVDGKAMTFSAPVTTVPPGGVVSFPITAATKTAGVYNDELAVGGVGLEGVPNVPVRMVVAPRPSGTPQPQPSASRKDVTAPANCTSSTLSVAESCTNPTYDVTFSNSGTGDVVAAFSSDKLFIVPPAGLAQIKPGETKTFTGSLDMTQYPDAASSGGTANGTLTLTYFSGTGAPAAGRIQPLDNPPGTGTISISIVSTVPPASSASAIPPLAKRCQAIGCWDEAALFVTGVGHVTGSVGQFISDLTLYPNVGFGTNPTYRALTNVDMYFTPLGAPSSSAVKATVAGVAPPASASFGDVVSTVYAMAQLGTLQVRAPDFQPDEIVGLNVNVFNVSNRAGTYGTTLPVFSSYTGVNGSSREFLTGLRKNATSHTNLYVQEVLGFDTNAAIDFYGPAAAKLGTAPVSLRAFGAAQLGGNSVPEGTVSAVVSVTGGTGAIHAYATPVDDASGDTWAVVDWSRVFSYYPTDFFKNDRNKLIPVAGAVHGANDTYFRTDVAIMNSGSVPASGTFKYYNRTGDVVSKPITLTPLETRVLEDVTTNFFGVTTDSVGFIIYNAASGNVVITSRNYTSKPGSAATYGTALPTLATVTPNGSGFISGFGIRKGRTERLGGVEDSMVGSTQPGTFRSSLGLVEVSGKPAKIQVTIYYDTQTVKTSTTEAASATYDLPANGFLLIGSFTNNILGSKRAALGDLHNVTVEFTVLDGDGQIVPFISSVDNGSGDSTFRVN